MTEADRRCAIYVRISRDLAGDEHGVANQLAVAEELARARGWTVVECYEDNDLSATTGKRRPRYEKLMEAAERREFDSIIVFQSSRLWRNRRERAEGIETLRHAEVSVVAVKGPSLDMSTAYGRAMAGLLGEFDTLEVEAKSERQQLAAWRRSENGKPPLGVRLTGYTPTGETVEHEAQAVRGMFSRFYAGSSLREIAAWLNQTGVPTRHGKPWNPSSVRTILTNPRYAGRAIYQGEVTGRPGNWESLVDETVFDVVNERLADPRRRKQQGTDRRYLGSGLFLCDVCDQPVYSHTASGSGPRYRCPAGAHFTRTAAPIDDLVLRLLRGRLAMPDLAGLLTTPESAEAQETAAEIKRLRRRLEQVQADYDNELIDGARYKVASEKAKAHLGAAETARIRLLGGSGIASILGAPDPVAAFDAAPLGTRRAVIEFFMTVRLKPAPRGRRFDPTTVEIEWNHARKAR